MNNRIEIGILYSGMKFKKDKKLHIRRLEKREIIEAFKMLGNEYRMNMILTLNKESGLTLDQINERVGGDFKNISMHMKKLSSAGLVHKYYEGTYVHHILTEYGKRSVTAFENFSKELSL